jgi:hypothetical protein
MWLHVERVHLDHARNVAVAADKLRSSIRMKRTPFGLILSLPLALRQPDSWPAVTSISYAADIMNNGASTN